MQSICETTFKIIHTDWDFIMRKTGLINIVKRICTFNKSMNFFVRSLLDDFLTKYCIISEGQANYYHRIFKTVSPFWICLTAGHAFVLKYRMMMEHGLIRSYASQGAFLVRPTPKLRQEFRSCTPSGRRGANARKMLRQPRPSIKGLGPGSLP